MKTLRFRSGMPFALSGVVVLLYAAIFGVSSVYGYLGALLMAFLVYEPMTHVFPDRYVVVEDIPRAKNAEVNRFIEDCVTYMRQIRSAGDKIYDPWLLEKVDLITIGYRSILTTISQKAELLPTFRPYLRYLMPTTVALLGTRVKLQGNDEITEQSLVTRRRIDETLLAIEQSLEAQMLSLERMETLEVETDLEVIQDVLGQTGILTDNDFRAIDASTTIQTLRPEELLMADKGRQLRDELITLLQLRMEQLKQWEEAEWQALLAEEEQSGRMESPQEVWHEPPEDDLAQRTALRQSLVDLLLRRAEHMLENDEVPIPPRAAALHMEPATFVLQQKAKARQSLIELLIKRQTQLRRIEQPEERVLTERDHQSAEPELLSPAPTSFLAQNAVESTDPMQTPRPLHHLAEVYYRVVGQVHAANQQRNVNEMTPQGFMQQVDDSFVLWVGRWRLGELHPRGLEQDRPAILHSLNPGLSLRQSPQSKKLSGVEIDHLLTNGLVVGSSESGAATEARVFDAPGKRRILVDESIIRALLSDDDTDSATS